MDSSLGPRSACTIYSRAVHCPKMGMESLEDSSQHLKLDLNWTSSCVFLEQNRNNWPEGSELELHLRFWSGQSNKSSHFSLGSLYLISWWGKSFWVILRQHERPPFIAFLWLEGHSTVTELIQGYFKFFNLWCHSTYTDWRVAWPNLGLQWYLWWLHFSSHAHWFLRTGPELQ